MNSQILETIKNTLSDPSTLTPEGLHTLVQETLAAFKNIQAKMTSKDEGDWEEGLRIASELKTAMEDQVEQLQKKLNMSPQQIEEYTSNPTNFSQEEFKSMNESKEDFDQFRRGLQEKKEAPIKKRKHGKKCLILG